MPRKNANAQMLIRKKLNKKLIGKLMKEQDKCLLEDSLPVPTGMVRVTIRDAKTGEIKSDDLTKNMFVTAGKNGVAAGLIQEASKGFITYCAVGTNTTAPALADTKLGTELYRKLISVRSRSGNVSTFQTFFTTAEANGTLKEAGLFGDAATGTVDSGTLYCHLAINRTKSASDTLTLSWAVTIG
jgi:hypothetical protein